MSKEAAARLIALSLVVGVPFAVAVARWQGDAGAGARTIEIHGKMSESGGWGPSDLTVATGVPLRLRLTSDDVVHGFAVGKLDFPPVDVRPGEVTETTLRFDKPGKYVFYCTRWCGVNHWRMRGTIEVTGGAEAAVESDLPLFLELDLDLDAPHDADVVPARPPSAARGARLGVNLGGVYQRPEYYRRRSPAAIWLDLRSNPLLDDLTDAALWDLVAWTWERNTTPHALSEGARLYRANCAACHGERGGGDGVMAAALAADSLAEFGQGTKSPADFTDRERMLGASPALLHGKIVRGGMGTGMPYWGPIFTDEQVWALVDYLWTFQFGRDSAGLSPRKPDSTTVGGTKG